MLQKVMSRFTTSISKFKANPNAVLSQTGGQAVAVSSHNEIQFYAVPAQQYELMMEMIEGCSPGVGEVAALNTSLVPAREITSRFLASQLAGSCRIEGLKVSSEDEALMQGVIEGRVDADNEINKIIGRVQAG